MDVKLSLNPVVKKSKRSHILSGSKGWTLKLHFKNK